MKSCHLRRGLGTEHAMPGMGKMKEDGAKEVVFLFFTTIYMAHYVTVLVFC